MRISLVKEQDFTNLALTVIAALTVHQIFRRNESVQHISRLLVLLVAVPASLVLVAWNEPKSRPLLGRLFRTFLVFYSALISSIATYRLGPWHPLATFPGPILCRVSKLYWALKTRTGQQNKLLAQLHEQYGEIVRIGPNEVSIASTECIEPLMGPSGLPKGQFWEGRAPASAPVRSLVGLRDRQEHTRRRRTWMRALTPSSTKYYERFITSRTVQMVDLLRQRESEIVDLSRWIAYYFFDVMSDLAFGDCPEFMKNGDPDNICHLLEASQSTLFLFGLVPWLGKLMFRVSYLLPILPGFKKYRDYAIGRVMKRNKEGSPHKDLFYHLIDEDGVLEQKPSMAEVMSDSSLAIIAGADTSTSVLVTALCFLMRYSKVYERVQKDVDSLGDDILDTQKQAQLQYVNAVLFETLRLWPPVLSGSQREVKKGGGDALIGPYLLPEGTAASIAFSLVHKDPQNFAPYPESFIPERWLSEEHRTALEPTVFRDENEFKLNHNALLAFSYGPASCPGKHLAWIELRMAMCLLMRNFNFQFAPGFDSRLYEEGIRDYYLLIKASLPATLSSRNRC